MLTSLPRDLLNNVVTPYLDGGDFFARLLALSHDSRSELKSSKKVFTSSAPLQVVAAHPDIVFTSVTINELDLWTHTHLLTQCTQLTINFNKPDGVPSTPLPSNYFMVVPTNVTHLRLIRNHGYGNRMSYFPSSVTKFEMIGCLLPFYTFSSLKNVVELVVTDLNVLSCWWPSLSYTVSRKSVSLHILAEGDSIKRVDGFWYPPSIMLVQNAAVYIGDLKSLHLDAWDRSALALHMIPDDLPFYVGGERIDVEQELYKAVEDLLKASEQASKKQVHYIELDLDDEPAPKRQRA